MPQPPSKSTVKEMPFVKTESDRSSESTSGSRSPTESSISRSQHFGTHIGYTTELEPLLFDLSADCTTTIKGTSYQKPDDRNAFLIPRPGGSRDGNDGSILRQIHTVVGSNAPNLLKIFGNTINRSLPIIQDDFFDFHGGTLQSDMDPALLAAMYTLSATSPICNARLSREDVDRLEEIAFRSFGMALPSPTLSVLQAGIVLMQRPNVDSKTLNTQLVGIAYELGLHLDCSSWSLSQDEMSMRKRLGWAVYMQDKWCSLIHGRPSLISKDHWAVPLLAEEDFADVGNLDEVTAQDVRRGRELFCQMAALTEILSTILETFYTLRSMQEVDIARQKGTLLILEKAKPVQIKLKEWFTQLPRSLKMDENMTGKPSSTGYLHLAYFATEITLHRCIIRSLTSNNTDPYLSHVCRSAAKTRLISAMDFVNRLRPEHLSSFWYFPSKVNFALIATFGSLLLATAPSQEETDFYQTRLSEYRWTLSVSSKSAGFLAFAVDSLDSSCDLLRGLPSKPSSSELSSQQPAILRPSRGLSPPQDETMADAPPMRLGQLSQVDDLVPTEGTNSGLISPSTSNSSDSATYEAYAGAFDHPNRGSLVAGLWSSHPS